MGIFGGTFDPVHYGHLVLAEQCREQLALDEVRLVPAAQPPHKPNHLITPGDQRAEMLEYAIAGHPRMQVDRRELTRSGPSFTVDTLESLKSEDATRELFLLLGADSLFEFPTWRDPRRILELATVAAVNRPGAPALDLAPLRKTLGTTADAIRLVTIPGCDLSASDLRQRVREGKSIRYLVPRAVECYIEQHQLYRQ